MSESMFSREMNYTHLYFYGGLITLFRPLVYVFACSMFTVC